jgi:nuclear pore complex protein Nup205
VKLSGLFAIDPELGVGRSCHSLPVLSKLTGLDIEDPDAAGKLYELLVAIARVICAVVLSRGSQNEQTLDQARKFLAENRLSILAVLKKSAGLGVSTQGSMKSTEELADSYTLLMSVTGFIDVSIST